MTRRVLCAMCALLLCACSEFSGLGSPRAVAPHSPAPADAGFRPLTLQGPDLTLHARLKDQRASTADTTLHIYIEGDGFAWQTRWLPSADPTPKNPVGWQLAAADPHPLVLYLARPCQYADSDFRGCVDSRFWTTERFSAPVVRAMEAAVEQMLQTTGARRTALFGYSGGATLAVLLAARRADVQFLGTVAGNLDLDLWTAHHALPPFAETANPRAVHGAVAHIPQAHVVGNRDTVIPESTAFLWCEGSPPSLCSVLQADATHAGPWGQAWAAVLRMVRQTEASRTLPPSATPGAPS